MSDQQELCTKWKHNGQARVSKNKFTKNQEKFNELSRGEKRIQTTRYPKIKKPYCKHETNSTFCIAKKIWKKLHKFQFALSWNVQDIKNIVRYSQLSIFSCSYPLAAYTARVYRPSETGRASKQWECVAVVAFALALAAPTRRPRFIYMGETHPLTHTHILTPYTLAYKTNYNLFIFCGVWQQHKHIKYVEKYSEERRNKKKQQQTHIILLIIVK